MLIPGFFSLDGPESLKYDVNKDILKLRHIYKLV